MFSSHKITFEINTLRTVQSQLHLQFTISCYGRTPPIDWLLLASCMIAVQQSVQVDIYSHCCMILLYDLLYDSCMIVDRE